MQVALEPAAFAVAARTAPAREARSCSQLPARLGLQPLVLEREPGGRAQLVDQRGVVEQAGAVHEHGDRA